jgi:hypothetical protein
MAPSPFAAGGAPMMGAPGAGPRPKKRNPMMIGLAPFMGFGVMIVLVILGMIIGGFVSLIFMLLGLAVVGAAGVFVFIQMISMINELQAITQNPNIAWWKLLIPVLGLIFMLSDVPNEMIKAKQMMGAQAPARGVIVYLFLPAYALAADLNDIAG